jgi:hypothetical protein
MPRTFTNDPGHALEVVQRELHGGNLQQTNLPGILVRLFLGNVPAHLAGRERTVGGVGTFACQKEQIAALDEVNEIPRRHGQRRKRKPEFPQSLFDLHCLFLFCMPGLVHGQLAICLHTDGGRSCNHAC